jgi:pimeloyl-ACP methyl ester carboxylesterase
VVADDEAAMFCRPRGEQRTAEEDEPRRHVETLGIAEAGDKGAGAAAEVRRMAVRCLVHAAVATPPCPSMTHSRSNLPLILLPGLDGTGSLFQRFVAELPDSLEPVVIPLPADRPRGYGELVEHVRGRLPAARPFALLGESFSGPIALRLAAERPAGLVALVLVASFHRRPVAPWLAATSALARAIFAFPPAPFAVRRFLSGPGAPVELVREIREAVRGVSAAVLASRVRAALAEDASAALAACPAPVLYVGGTRDRLLRPALAEEIRRLRPAARLESLEAPHLVLQRAPREAAGVISAFLARAAGEAVGS